MIYLDYAATTPLDPRVDDAMRPFGQGMYGNPSSLHAAGRRTRAAIDAARDTIADLLHAASSEIIFTSGGTEADNLAIKGVAHAAQSRGNHIVTTAIEHHAVLGSCLALEREGFQVTYLRPDTHGVVTVAQVADALTPVTILVSVMLANNETGVVQPVTEIGALCRARRIPLHTDAVQAAGQLPLDTRTLSVDLLTISAHKVYGPKGVGALFVRAGTRLQRLQDGGEQEQGRRAGTENVAGIVGLAAALTLAVREPITERLCALQHRLRTGLLAIPGARLHGDPAYTLPSHVNIGFTGVIGETLLLALDLEDIAVSTGAACAAGALEPSHILIAMGYTRQQAQEAIRFTLGRYTTDAEVDAVLAVCARLVPHLQHSRR